MSGRDVVRALQSVGFEVAGTKGSHVKLRRLAVDGSRQTLTIPLHDALATGTIRAIVRQASKFVAEEQLTPLFFTD